MKNSTMKSKILAYIISLVLIYLISFILYSFKDNELVYPNPNYIIYTFFSLFVKSKTYKAILFSLISLFICLIISFLISLILSYLAYKFTFLYNFFNPYIVLFRSSPVISISVLFIILFGHTYSVFVITNVILIPLFYEGLYEGFVSTDKNIIDAYKLDSKLSIKILFKLYLPININKIKMLLIEGVGLGFKVLLTSEYLNSKDGSLGSLLFNAYQNNIDMTEIYAYTILIVLISLIITGVTKKIKK